MVRFLLNAVGAALLAVALVFAVSDIARSIARDTMVTTSVAEGLLSVGLTPRLATEQSGGAIDVVAVVSAWPASATIGAVSLLLLFLGRPRSRRVNRTAR